MDDIRSLSGGARMEQYVLVNFLFHYQNPCFGSFVRVLSGVLR